jgi:anti-sigma regulatory factor (Ser/Thr protein kinase)
MSTLDQRKQLVATPRAGSSAPCGQLAYPRERGTVLGAIPEAPGTCRYIIRAALRIRGLAELAGDAEIIVTELASNAVWAMREEEEEEAGGRLAEDMPIIALALGWPAHGVRIEIWDEAPGLPRMREPDWDVEQGRGLFLVHQLTAGRWGCRRVGAAKCVWAELIAVSDQGAPYPAALPASTASRLRPRRPAISHGYPVPCDRVLPGSG